MNDEFVTANHTYQGFVKKIINNHESSTECQ